MTEKKIKDKVREDTYTEKLEKKLLESEKRNKQLLTALRSAKRTIKELHNEACGDMGEHFWKVYQQLPQIQRINKAIKNGKV